MAYELPGFKFTLEAGADLSSSQYKLVKVNSSSKVIACAATTDIPIGILQNKPVSGDAAEIMAIGISKVQADSALTAGNVFGTSSDGQAAPYVAGTDTTKYGVGIVIEGAGSTAGNLATVFINCTPNRLA